MIDTKKIIEAAERNLQGTDMYVVGCTCTPGNDIELLIDSDTSVAIDACAVSYTHLTLPTKLEV